jgi:hypothetical protein
VQHRQEADASAEVPRRRRDLQGGFGRRLEEQVVDYRLVLIGHVAERRRQRVYDVKIRHRQQLGLALSQPLASRRALALRAMPIAAANGRSPLAALWAKLLMGSWQAVGRLT